jgi:hypothetical protein
MLHSILPSLIEGSGGLFDFDLTLYLVFFQFVFLTFVLDLVFYRPIEAVFETREDRIYSKFDIGKNYLFEAKLNLSLFEKTIKDFYFLNKGVEYSSRDFCNNIVDMKKEVVETLNESVDDYVKKFRNARMLRYITDLLSLSTVSRGAIHDFELERLGGPNLLKSDETLLCPENSPKGKPEGVGSEEVSTTFTENSRKTKGVGESPRELTLSNLFSTAFPENNPKGKPEGMRFEEVSTTFTENSRKTKVEEGDRLKLVEKTLSWPTSNPFQISPESMLQIRRQVVKRAKKLNVDTTTVRKRDKNTK